MKVRGESLQKRAPDFFLRLISSFCLLQIGLLATEEVLFNEKSFGQAVPPVVLVLAGAGIFAVLTGIHWIIKRKIDAQISIVCFGLYAFILLLEESNIYFYAGVLLVTFLFLFYVFRYKGWRLREFRVSKKGLVSGISLLAFLFILFVGGLTVCRYLCYYSPNFDFGIFTQIYHSMRTTGLPNATCERDGLLSHFAVHFSPALYLLLPFYALFPSPVTLLVMQAVVLASGVIPMALLCRKFQLNRFLTLCMCTAYLCYPSLAGGCFYDFHENKLLPALLLWLVYVFECKKTPWIYGLGFLVMMVKEDAPVYVAVLALYFLFSKKNVRHGAILFGLSIAYFLAVTGLMSRFGLGIMSYRYNNLIINPEDGLLGVIKTVLVNPAYVIKESFSAERIEFLLAMLLPVAFLPLLGKKPSALLLWIPFFLVNLMPDYEYQHSIYFQYTYGSMAFLMYLSVMNLAALPEKKKPFIGWVAAIASLMAVVTVLGGKGYYWHVYLENREQSQKITQVLESIPQERSVVCDTFYIPRIADRAEIYEYPSAHEAQVLVRDLRGRVKNAPEEPGYTLKEEITGVIAVYEKAEE